MTHAVRRNSNFFVAASVALFHVAALWALQTGLLRHAVEVMVPVAVLGEFITPPEPNVQAPAPLPELPAPPQRLQVAPAQRRHDVVKPAARPQAPRPVAIADATPSDHAVTGDTLAQPPSPLNPAPVAAEPAPVAAPAPKVELPSSNADYLQNPKPAYPPMSRRLNEQGKVIVRVLIGANGQPQQSELGQSSGFSRLDQAALQTVMAWRYVPGKRGGVAEAMWFNVPINFVLG
ncbi:MAG: energy transducer TonB [Polaromonas sp.]